MNYFLKDRVEIEIKERYLLFNFSNYLGKLAASYTLHSSDSLKERRVFVFLALYLLLDGVRDMLL